MRKLNYMCQLYFVASTDPETAGRPLANSIQSKNSRLIKRGGEKGAGGVGFVVLSKNVTALIAVVTALPSGIV
jgi:hypothetical protein